MVLRKELVQVHQKYASQEEALRSIAQTFVDLGVVKESFPQAIIDREAVYPTGLDGYKSQQQRASPQAGRPQSQLPRRRT